MMTDLHIHTTASDGQYTPAQVVEMAKNAGIKCIAITDHDTLDGIAEGIEAAQRHGIEFIPGIELSVKSDRELHILGLNIDHKNHDLLSFCKELAEGRDQRGPRIIKFLKGYGIALELEQVQQYASGGILGRPHFARALLDNGYVKTTQEAFDKYLATPAFKKIERPKPTPREGIELILHAGGTAVLAHPVQTKRSDDELEKLIVELKSYGLCGIECYYSTHTPEQTKLYLSLARKYNLAVTGGSDFHGEKVKPTIPLKGWEFDISAI